MLCAGGGGSDGVGGGVGGGDRNHRITKDGLSYTMNTCTRLSNTNSDVCVQEMRISHANTNRT